MPLVSTRVLVIAGFVLLAVAVALLALLWESTGTPKRPAFRTAIADPQRPWRARASCRFEHHPSGAGMPPAGSEAVGPLLPPSTLVGEEASCHAFG